MTTWSAVLLDRDGTVNVKAPEGEYVARPEQLTLLPGAGSAVRRLRDAGIAVYVVTNQRGVARGIMTPHDLDAVHDRLRLLLAAAGTAVDGIYACVHEAGECGCRKPKPGLLHRLAREHPEVDLSRCAMVGDAASDVAAGAAAGCATVRLAAEDDPEATTTARSLPEAVTWLLR